MYTTLRAGAILFLTKLSASAAHRRMTRLRHSAQGRQPAVAESSGFCDSLARTQNDKKARSFRTSGAERVQLRNPVGGA